MAEKKKIKKSLKSTKADKTGNKKYAQGKKLGRKNNLVRFLRISVVVCLIVFIGLVLHHYRAIPLIRQVVVHTGTEKAPDLNDIISEAAASIGIDEKNFSLKNESDHVYINLGINAAEFDLALVNSILTGKVISAGGRLVTAQEADSGNNQILEFRHENNKLPYIVRLYYGKYEEAAPEVFLIIDDFGSFNNSLLDDFCDLDSAVSFAILPNEPYYKEVMEKSHLSGHDILIHIPMEPIDIRNNNPGNDAILVQYSPGKIKSLMSKFIERLPLAIAANNHMGSLATSRTEVMQPVLQVLKENDLIFIDSYTSAGSVVKQVAQDETMKIWQRDLFLDEMALNPEVLKQKLEDLDRIATRTNQIIVIGHCHSRSRLDFIKDFMSEAINKGYRFSPVSDLKKKSGVDNA
jgi:uncharacterized protein